MENLNLDNMEALTVKTENEKNSLYKQFSKYSYAELHELFKKATNKEEQDFYISLATIVLQREYKKIIGKKQ